VEKQAREQSQLTATTTKTTNVHGDSMTVTTTTQYEQVGYMPICPYVIVIELDTT
jgi:pre-mRNA-processing factor 8